jgi:hypothetical protein
MVAEHPDHAAVLRLVDALLDRKAAQQADDRPS